MIELSSQLMNHHSPGNRFSYYPLTSKWQDVKKEIPTFDQPKDSDFSLYIHLPFCKEICTYCGCNIKISIKEEEHLRYVEAIQHEFELKTKYWDHIPKISRLTLGGGTPNALHPKAKEKLLHWLAPLMDKSQQKGLMEADPRYFTKEDRDWAHEVGIQNYCFGVEDFDQKILSNVNRRQSPDDLFMAIDFLEDSDAYGVDLLWGLPRQSTETIGRWFDYIKEFRPDWISYYPLAKVPWLESIQQAYGDFTLPTPLEKYELYARGVEIFEELSYANQGMGHFIQREGKLSQALESKSIYRKVSGIYTSPVRYSLGLGVSAISESSTQLAQNDKIIDRYLFRIFKKEEAPYVKFHEKTPLEVEMNELVELIFTKNQIKEEHLVHFNEDAQRWFSPTNAPEFYEITPNGQHFKKNVMQILELEHFKS